MKIWLISLLSFCFTQYASAQVAASLDQSFNTTDLGFGFGDGANAEVNAIVSQPGGKYVICGAFTLYNTNSVNYAVRVNADGSHDPSFNAALTAGQRVTAAAVQQDGKILVGTYGGSSYNVYRLNTDGSLDGTFGNATLDAPVSAIVVQADGKKLIAGSFTSYAGQVHRRIVRLNDDGSIDVSFNAGTGFNSVVYSIAIQPNGLIVAAGNFTQYNGTTRNQLARLNTDGTPDPSFNPGTGTDANAILSIALQPDNKIIIGGAFNQYNGTARANIARVNADGTLDASFNPGTGTNNTVQTIALQQDGKVLAGGFFSTFNSDPCNNIIRLTVTGTNDAGFNPGTGTNANVLTIHIPAANRILIGGMFNRYNGFTRKYVTALYPTGEIDSTFNQGTGANDMVLASAKQNDNKIVIAGNFTNYNGKKAGFLARILADGAADTAFLSKAAANNSITAVALQPDGKIIIGGAFTIVNTVSNNRIARLSTDGSLDNTFNTGSGANATVYAVAVQPDGKVLIAGAFSSFNGNVQNHIVRLNVDGTLDAGFNTGSGANNFMISAIALQPDGKILLGGDFTTFNGVAANRVCRLNDDGTVDVNFNTGTGANAPVYAIALQQDGKIILGGELTTYNNISRQSLARLNADGTLDNSFIVGAGANSAVLAISIQPDNKIIIGGAFTTYDNQVRRYLARVNNDGALDAGFDPQSISGGSIRTLQLVEDNKLLVGGGFRSINGIGRNRVAKLYLGSGVFPLVLTNFNLTRINNDVMLHWQVVPVMHGKFNIQSSTTGNGFVTIATVNNAGLQHNWSFTDRNTDRYGANKLYYRLQLVDEDGTISYSNILVTQISSSKVLVNAFPRPAYSILNVTINDRSSDAGNIVIYSMSGEMLLQQPVTLNNGIANLTLNLSKWSFANGLYTLHWVTKSGVQQLKFIKH